MIDEETLEIAKQAAKRANVHIEYWIIRAIRSKAEEESISREPRKKDVALSGFWQNWHSRESWQGGTDYRGPDGEEISYMGPRCGGDIKILRRIRPYWARPEAESSLLLRRDGRIRTFYTPEGAKKAIEAHRAKGRIISK